MVAQIAAAATGDNADDAHAALALAARRKSMEVGKKDREKAPCVITNSANNSVSTVSRDSLT